MDTTAELISDNKTTEDHQLLRNSGISSVSMSGIIEILQTTVESITYKNEENGNVLELSYPVIIPLAVIGAFLTILLIGFLIRLHCCTREGSIHGNRSSFFRSNITPHEWRSSTHSNQSTTLLHRGNDDRHSSRSTKSHVEFSTKLNKISESPEIRQQKNHDQHYHKKITTPLSQAKECTCRAAHSEPPKKHSKVLQEHVNNSFVDSESTLDINNTISEFNKYGSSNITQEMQVSSEPNLLSAGRHGNNEMVRPRASNPHAKNLPQRPSYISGLPQFNPLLMKAISDCKLGSRTSVISRKGSTDSNLENSNSTRPSDSMVSASATSRIRSTTHQWSPCSTASIEKGIKRKSTTQANAGSKRPQYGQSPIPTPVFDGPSFASSISYDSSKLTVNSASEVSLASNLGQWQYNQLYKDPSVPVQCRINDLSSIQVLSDSNHESSHVSMYPSMGSFDNGNGNCNSVATNTDISNVTNHGSSNVSRVGHNENSLQSTYHKENVIAEQRKVGRDVMTSNPSQPEVYMDWPNLPKVSNPFSPSNRSVSMMKPSRRTLRRHRSPYAQRSCVTNPLYMDTTGESTQINPKNLSLSTSIVTSDTATVHNNTPTGANNKNSCENISMISTSDAGFGQVGFFHRNGNGTPVSKAVNVASWALHHSLPVSSNDQIPRVNENYFNPPRKIFSKHWENVLNQESPSSVSSDSNTISVPVSPTKRPRPLKRYSFDPSDFHRQQDILRRSARARRSHPQRIPLKSKEYWV